MSALDQPQVESSLEVSLEKARPRLRALFTHFRIPSQDTDDILQQALLALVYQVAEIRDPEAWLVGTVRNKCLLYWREKRRRLYDSVDSTVLECVAEPIEPTQETTALRRDLATALEHLPRRCRSLLALRYRHGYEPPELAERMGYSPGSISKVTNRCLAALTRYMTLLGMGLKRGRDD
jgi:RNA polymerase sigma factor (sigma-70 family)